ncbi:hypothetical protein GGR56DRAFT_41212 [Xylariaceae sp. FL0804]|nr:hypothetical protein GGR56DRAFT_41212 [Xylariaceae sp. FL0804]
MWQQQLAWLLTIAASTASVAEPVDPLQFSAVSEFSAVLKVLKRDLTCPADYFSCEKYGSAFAGTCCQDDQVCSLDAYQQAACCPTTATCTGVAPSTTATTTSYVRNSYFSFPYVQTSFSNQAACTAAVSACSANYQACVSDLGGLAAGGYGVTIQVPGGGGTTVAATQASLEPATATSVCSSLSSKACHNLAASSCTDAGGSGGFVVGSGNGAPRVTAPPCVAGVVAGLGLGIMGAHL